LPGGDHWRPLCRSASQWGQRWVRASSSMSPECRCVGSLIAVVPGSLNGLFPSQGLHWLQPRSLGAWLFARLTSRIWWLLLSFRPEVRFGGGIADLTRYGG